MRFLLAPIAVLAALALTGFSCTSPDGRTAGGGNESPNAFGYVIPGPGTGASVEGATVSMYKIFDVTGTGSITNYSWILARSVKTSATGFFRIDSVVDSSITSFALMVEQGDHKAFGGYVEHPLYGGDMIEIDTLALLPMKRVSGTFSYVGNYGNWKIVAGEDTINTSDTVSVSIGLVGTPFSGQVSRNKKFAFDYLPRGNYMMEIVYNLRDRVSDSTNTYYDLYITNYTAFIADPQKPEYFIDDPYVVRDSIEVLGDTVRITSSNYIIRYTVSGY